MIAALLIGLAFGGFIGIALTRAKYHSTMAAIMYELAAIDDVREVTSDDWWAAYRQHWPGGQKR